MRELYRSLGLNWAYVLYDAPSGYNNHGTPCYEWADSTHHEEDGPEGMVNVT